MSKPKRATESVRATYAAEDRQFVVTYYNDDTTQHSQIGDFSDTLQDKLVEAHCTDFAGFDLTLD